MARHSLIRPVRSASPGERQLVAQHRAQPEQLLGAMGRHVPGQRDLASDSLPLPCGRHAALGGPLAHGRVDLDREVCLQPLGRTLELLERRDQLQPGPAVVGALRAGELDQPGTHMLGIHLPRLSPELIEHVFDSMPPHRHRPAPRRDLWMTIQLCAAPASSAAAEPPDVEVRVVPGISSSWVNDFQRSDSTRASQSFSE